MRAKITSGSGSLDKMLDGGIPVGNIVVLAGGPGAGKTLLAFEFAYKNAKAGRKALILSLEENEEAITRNAKEAFTDFTDIDVLIKENRIVIYDSAKIMKRLKGLTVFTRETFVDEFFKNINLRVVPLIQDHNAEVVAFDGFSIMKSYLRDLYSYRDLTAKLSDVLKELGVTAIITSELVEADGGRPNLEPEFFAYDGIIVFYSLLVESKIVPLAEIIKMRGSDHSYEILPYKIMHSGIEVSGEMSK